MIHKLNLKTMKILIILLCEITNQCFNTTDIQLSLDNDKFWLTYNIVKSPADGHCFVHSIAKSLGSQLPEHVCFKQDTTRKTKK